MSRLAKKPVVLTNGAKVNIEAASFSVEGPLGKLQYDYKPELIQFKEEDGKIFVERKGNSNKFRAFQGLYFRLIQNAVSGVTTGFKKVLKIVGVGYKWQVQGDKLVCNVGLSHPVEFKVPDGVKLLQDNPLLVTVTGADKCLVGQVAANIRFIRPPESYKGKGIRYENEVVRLKEGKSASK